MTMKTFNEFKPSTILFAFLSGAFSVKVASLKSCLIFFVVSKCYSTLKPLSVDFFIALSEIGLLMPALPTYGTMPIALFTISVTFSSKNFFIPLYIALIRG